MRAEPAHLIDDAPTQDAKPGAGASNEESDYNEDDHSADGFSVKLFMGAKLENGGNPDHGPNKEKHANN